MLLDQTLSAEAIMAAGGTGTAEVLNWCRSSARHYRQKAAEGPVTHTRSGVNAWNYSIGVPTADTGGFSPPVTGTMTFDGLCKLPVLVLPSNDELAPATDVLVKALQAKSDAHVTAIHADTDHGWSSHLPRITGHHLAWNLALDEYLQLFHSWDFDASGSLLGCTSMNSPLPCASTSPASSRIFASAQCLRPSLRVMRPSMRMAAFDFTGRR